MTPPRRTPMALVAIGAIAAAMLVDRAAGLGVSVVALAVLALTAPKHPWTLLAAALGAVATVRAAEWIVWPSLAAAYALGALAAGGAAWRSLGTAIVRAGRLDRGLELVARATAPSVPRRSRLAGAGITVALLAVFLPLFATADAAFAHLLGELVPNHGLDQPAGRAATWLGVIAAGGALLWAARQPAVGPASPARARLGRAESAAPLIALVALFAVFVALQVHTLFAGHDHVLRTAGLTYAEYAREGFAQLLAASALTLAVVAAAVRWGRASRVLLGALCALTLVVLAAALVRLDLYVDAYGLTRLRLSAQAAILYLAGVFALVLIAGATRRATWLPRAAVALTGAAVLAFALSNPDRRIAERNVGHPRPDERLLRGLSADAAPALPCELIAPVGPDGLVSLNLARERARDALARCTR